MKSLNEKAKAYMIDSRTDISILRMNTHSLMFVNETAEDNLKASNFRYVADIYAESQYWNRNLLLIEINNLITNK